MYWSRLSWSWLVLSVIPTWLICQLWCLPCRHKYSAFELQPITYPILSLAHHLTAEATHRTKDYMETWITLAWLGTVQQLSWLMELIIIWMGPRSDLCTLEISVKLPLFSVALLLEVRKYFSCSHCVRKLTVIWGSLTLAILITHCWTFRALHTACSSVWSSSILQDMEELVEIRFKVAKLGTSCLKFNEEVRPHKTPDNTLDSSWGHEQASFC